MAIMYSHDSDAGLRIEEYANGLRYYLDWTNRFYFPFHDHYLHRDVISPASDLSNYEVLFIPIMPILPQATRDRLQDWVAQGGTLIVGPMTGYRSELWTSFTDYAMGDLAKWSGIDVTSRIPVGTQRRAAEVPLMLNYHDDLGWKPTEAGLWSEALTSTQGTVLAHYQSGMHDGQPAIVENTVGKGKVVLLGTDPGREVMGNMLLHYAEAKGIAPTLGGEPGVLAVPRGANNEGLILVNLNNAPKKITLPSKPWQDFHAKEPRTGEVTLQPYEVQILQKP